MTYIKIISSLFLCLLCDNSFASCGSRAIQEVSLQFNSNLIKVGPNDVIVISDRTSKTEYVVKCERDKNRWVLIDEKDNKTPMQSNFQDIQLADENGLPAGKIKRFDACALGKARYKFLEKNLKKLEAELKLLGKELGISGDADEIMELVDSNLKKVKRALNDEGAYAAFRKSYTKGWSCELRGEGNHESSYAFKCAPNRISCNVQSEGNARYMKLCSDPEQVCNMLDSDRNNRAACTKALDRVSPQLVQKTIEYNYMLRSLENMEEEFNGVEYYTEGTFWALSNPDSTKKRLEDLDKKICTSSPIPSFEIEGDGGRRIVIDCSVDPRLIKATIYNNGQALIAVTSSGKKSQSALATADNLKEFQITQDCITESTSPPNSGAR